MKLTYVNIEVEVVNLNAADIIVTSSGASFGTEEDEF